MPFTIAALNTLSLQIVTRFAFGFVRWRSGPSALTTDPTSAAGKHRNIFCQVQLSQYGEPIVQNTGSTELRIDVPLAPKPNAPVVKNPATPAPAKPAEKRLSRLEQLRLEQEEREKTKAGTAPPK